MIGGIQSKSGEMFLTDSESDDEYVFLLDLGWWVVNGPAGGMTFVPEATPCHRFDPEPEFLESIGTLQLVENEFRFKFWRKLISKRIEGGLVA